MVERFHRNLKASLRAHGAADHWPEVLPWVLLGLRSSPRGDEDISSYEAVFGRPPVLPASILQGPEVVSAALRRPAAAIPVRPTPPQSSNVPAGLRHVFLCSEGQRSPLQPRYSGPYRVLKQTRNTVRLLLGDREEVVNIGRVKPCHDPDPVVAVPPRRGRPAVGEACGASKKP